MSFGKDLRVKNLYLYLYFQKLTTSFMLLLSTLYRTTEGGRNMHYILSFLVSIMAAVVSYYIRKWLDRNDKDN